jgi:hypothetical protein
VGSDDEHRPAGLRLVHAAARAQLSTRAGAALAALAAALCLSGGCGGGHGADGAPVAWVGAPQILTPPDLERDRVLRGTVRNDTGHVLRVTAAQVRVLAADGRPLRSDATFIAGYAHRLFPPTRGPRDLPERERERLGQVAVIAPGKTARVTVSWRTRGNGDSAVRVDLGPGSLDVPREASASPDL